MEHSKAYYVIRGICRFLTLCVIATFWLGAFYAFILIFWAAFYP